MEFLEDTLRSVLIQNIPAEDMQIEVVDDASTDGDVETFVNNVGKGRIQYYRQKNNVGSLRNFETCINRSYGELVHLLHGDDRVRQGYYKSISDLFHQYNKIGAAFCRYSYINEKGEILFNQSSENNKGILKHWLLSIAERQLIQYVAITVKREVYEKLGSFYAITYAEDWEMWVRIARHFEVAYTPEILADYRKHGQSISGKKFLNADYLDDLTHAMELIQQHLPAKQKKKILKKSKQFYGHYALKMANQLWHFTHDKKVAKANVKRGLKMHKDFFMYLKSSKIYLKILIGWK